MKTTEQDKTYNKNIKTIRKLLGKTEVNKLSHITTIRFKHNGLFILPNELDNLISFMVNNDYVTIYLNNDKLNDLILLEEKVSKKESLK